VSLCYGEGGHKAEIERLYYLLIHSDNNIINYIGICEGKNIFEQINNYKLLTMSTKYNKVCFLFLFSCACFYNILKILFLILKYKPKEIISTGPG
jgi:hypothetical protein